MLPAVMTLAFAAVSLPVMKAYFAAEKIRIGTRSILLKMIPTLLAALLALTGAIRGGSGSAWLIFAGVFVGALADGLLCRAFVPGAALFAIGHVLYAAAIVPMNAGRAGTWIAAALLYAVMACHAVRWAKTVPKKLTAAALLYAAFLSLLAGSALYRPFTGCTPAALCCAAGGVLFAVSDMMLVANKVRRRGYAGHFIALGVYYLAQWMIAMSAFLS